MANKTNIPWATHTINPIVGCSKCSPGCTHCYAEKMALRLSRIPATAAKYAGVVDENGWTGLIRSEVINPDETINYSGKPIEEYFWHLPKKPARVFVGSMTDMFHENAEIRDLQHVLLCIHKNPQHTFIMLTKRANIMLERMASREVLPNLWLGVTVCNQQEADEKIPVLLQTPAAKRFVSIEPCLGPVDIGHYLYGSWECALSCGTRLPCTSRPEKSCTKCGFTGPDNYETWGDGDCEECPECGQDGCCGAIEEICPDCGTYMALSHPDTQYINWVISGGESGPNARPAHPDWFRSLRDQCKAAGVPYMHKQNGEFECIDNFEGQAIMHKCGKVRAGRLIDGVEHMEVPE